MKKTAIARQRIEVLPPDNQLIGSCVLFTSMAVLHELDRMSVLQPGPLELKRTMERCRDALASHFPGLGNTATRAKEMRAELRALVDKRDFTHLSQLGANHG